MCQVYFSGPLGPIFNKARRSSAFSNSLFLQYKVDLNQEAEYLFWQDVLLETSGKFSLSFFLLYLKFTNILTFNFVDSLIPGLELENWPHNKPHLLQ